jgi:hypothetical protein
MILEILKPYGKWQVGATPDVTNELARSLIAAGIGRAHGDQTRRDVQPKEPEPEAQPLTVNNYFLTPESVEEKKPKKKISQPKKAK